MIRRDRQREGQRPFVNLAIRTLGAGNFYHSPHLSGQPVEDGCIVRDKGSYMFCHT